MTAERDIARDAARYRWLRERLEVRQLQAVSGSVRPGLEVRLGCEFFDVVQRERNRRPKLADELDAAIDAVILSDNQEGNQ